MTVENLPRRQFLRGKFLSSLQNNPNREDFNGIRPPWSKDNHVFIVHCTRCGDCIQKCETHILIKGEGGFPQVQFNQGECTFCHRCVDVCQQPIFRPLEERPWEHWVEITSQCLTQRKIECRSCQDNCPMNAIRFHSQIGSMAQPIVNLDSCNGCGACLHSCPVSAIKITYPNNDE